MKIQSTKPAKLLEGTKRHVQGIGSSIDDLTFKGEMFRARLGNAVLLDAPLTRTIEGASTLRLVVHDADGELRRSDLLLEQFDVEVDGLHFRFTGVNRQDRYTLELIFQARNVARLRIAPGAKKGKRGQYTRAEFWVEQTREKGVVKGKDIPIWVPELHEVQPIENARQAKQSKAEANVTRGKGIDEMANAGLDPSAKLTVKGAAATPEQIKNGDTILRTGASLDAPGDAMVACTMAAIQENNLTNQNHGAACMNIFCVTTAAVPVVQSAGADVSDVAANAKIMYTTGYWHAGLIDSINSGLSPGEAAQQAEGSGYPDAYNQWESEARTWLEAFGGGTTSSGTTTSTTTETKAYSFQRKADETIWANGVRLFEEVNWRFFESADVIYVITEPELLDSKIRMRIKDDADGVEAITYEYLVGKKQDQVSVTARTKTWAAPPGTVAAVHGQGPVDGRYIVSTIESNLLAPEDPVQITLKRPQKPLPEPAPETTTKTVKAGGTGRTATSTVGGSSVGAQLLSWAEGEIGTSEGSSQQVEYASELGYSASLPWCSIFIAYGLKTAVGYDISGLDNPAHSSTWLAWSQASEVSTSSLEAGDIVVFDWGDGGETDHVAIYAGDGQVVGGNQSNAVTKTSFSSGSCVGAVRIDG